MICGSLCVQGGAIISQGKTKLNQVQQLLVLLVVCGYGTPCWDVYIRFYGDTGCHTVWKAGVFNSLIYGAFMDISGQFALR